MTPREIRFATTGLTALVVLTVAGAMANLTWRLAGEPGGASSVSAATNSYVAPAPPPDITGLISLPPFGRVAIAPAAARADLILHGVLMAVPAIASSALIASTGQETIAYRVGDPLPGGGVLDAVGEDYVVLRVGDRYSTIYFPNDERAMHPQSGAAPAAGPTVAAPQTGGGADAIRALLPPSVRGDNSRPGRGEPVPMLMPNAPPPAADGNALIDSLGATVTPQGYQVGANIAPQLRSAGLVPGDVIARVNGVDAARLAADPARAAEVVASGSARLEVVRGGARVTLSIPVR